MKHHFLIFTVLFLCAISASRAQNDPGESEPDLEMPGRKLFTLNQAAFTVGLGVLMETGISTGDLKASWLDSDDTREMEFSYGGAITLGWYSPNSIISLTLRGAYSEGANPTIVQEQQEKLSYKRIEAPVHLRFNLSKDVTSTFSTVLFGGPAFAYYLERKSELSDVAPFVQHYYSAQIGLALETQTFSGNQSRLNLELIYSHPIGRTVSEEYAEFARGLKIGEDFDGAGIGYLSLGANYFFGR